MIQPVIVVCVINILFLLVFFALFLTDFSKTKCEYENTIANHMHKHILNTRTHKK